MSEGEPPSAPTTPVPGPGPSGPGPLGTLAGTFTNPGETFAALVTRPTWWLPFVLWLAAVALSIFVAMPKIDMVATIRDQMEKRAAQSGQTVNESQVKAQAAAAEKFGMLALPFGTLFSAIVFFVTAACLWGAGRAMGGEMGYVQTLAIWGHANLPNVVSGLVSVPIFLQIPDGSITQKGAQHVLKSNVGAFLPDGTPAALVSLAGSLDVFSLAALGLLIVGFRRLPGLSKGAATAVPIVLWALYVAGKTAWVALLGG